MEFIYTQNPQDEYPVMLINKHIGWDSEDGAGVLEDQFTKELIALDNMGKRRIQIWINSIGGNVKEGWGIYSAILKVGAKVDTYCVGLAASIAGVIFVAGAKRVMMEHSRLMLHNPYMPSENYSQGVSKELETMKGSIQTMLSSRCSLTQDEIGKIMDRTSWIEPAEALQMGLCTEIDKNSEFNKVRVNEGVRSKEAINSLSKDILKITNKVLNHKSPKNMEFEISKIANRLDLNPEASHSAIISEIEKIQNKAKSLSTSLEEKDNEIATLKNALNKAKEEAMDKELFKKNYEEKKAAFDKMKDELDEMKNAIEKHEKEITMAEEERRKKEAGMLVNAFVESGAIAKEETTITKWVAKATADYEGTKELLESIPSVKKAVIVGAVNSSKEPVQDADKYLNPAFYAGAIRAAKNEGKAVKF